MPHLSSPGLAACALLASLAVATGLRAQAPAAPPSPGCAPRRLVLALDGVPFDVFRDLQERGHFTDFRPAARLVSTFPSLTDVAFSAIAGTEPPEGFQVMRYDRETGEIVGNTMKSLSGEAHAHLPSDSKAQGSLHRMVTYVLPYRMALDDLHAAGRQFLASDKTTFVAYIEGTDAVLHVHGRERCEEFLLKLEVFLENLQAEATRRTGRPLRVDIVSDHGSTLVRGQRVPIEGLLQECGFCRKERLCAPDEVAYAQAGIIGTAAVSCDPERAEAIARCLATAEGIDVVLFRRGPAVVVASAEGEAEILLLSESPERYRYRLITGDPLHVGTALPEVARLGLPATIDLDESVVFAASADASHPDPLRRAWRAFHGAVEEPPEVIVSLADGHEIGNGAVRLLARIRGRAGTHGSLTRSATLGVLASNWTDVQDVSAWDVTERLFGVEGSERPAGPAIAGEPRTATNSVARAGAALPRGGSQRSPRTNGLPAASP